ncbi:hypothetical protein KM043_016860 [Ampulex compressa]|nr:hypothetical protein KM043_016860 [Ampulex compressa]
MVSPVILNNRTVSRDNLSRASYSLEARSMAPGEEWISSSPYRGFCERGENLGGESTDVDGTLFRNNNYRETRDMSKYCGCCRQRLTPADEEKHRTARGRGRRTFQRACDRFRQEEERAGEKEGRIQPLAELDRFEKS